MKYKAVMFGKKLQEYRKEKNMSRESLAKKSALRESHIYAIESGRRTDPRFSTILKICNALDIGFDDLILRTK